jgi:nicotinamide-nucleotide amidase
MIADMELEALAREVGHALTQRGIMLATAESCTGGWIAQTLTSIEGSSHWFERGFVTYSNTAKRELLGVSATTLARQGAVSEATVRAMAEGALQHSHAEVTLAVTGIAGPGGGTPEKPVGTVWLAWAGKKRAPLTRKHVFSGDREAVRRQAAASALQGLLSYLGPM